MRETTTTCLFFVERIRFAVVVYLKELNKPSKKQPVLDFPEKYDFIYLKLVKSIGISR